MTKTNPVKAEVNGLLKDFASFLRKVDGGMGKDTDPSVRKAVAEYIAVLEKNGGNATGTPPVPPERV